MAARKPNPYDDCVLIMPNHRGVKGQRAFRLGKPISGPLPAVFEGEGVRSGADPGRVDASIIFEYETRTPLTASPKVQPVLISPSHGQHPEMRAPCSVSALQPTVFQGFLWHLNRLSRRGCGRVDEARAIRHVSPNPVQPIRIGFNMTGAEDPNCWPDFGSQKQISTAEFCLRSSILFDRLSV